MERDGVNEEEKRFLDKMLEQVKYKNIRPRLKEEVQDHIECLKETYKNEGLTEQEACSKAINQMGDAEEIGRQLHKQHKPEMEWSIFTLVGSLIILGLIILSSLSKAYLALSGAYESYAENKEIMAGAFGKQLLFIGVGIVLFGLFYRLDYTKLKKYSKLIYAVGIIMLLITRTIGVTVSGSTKFLSIAGCLVDMTALIYLPLIIGSVGMIIEALSKGKLVKLAVTAVFGITFLMVMSMGLSHGLQFVILWMSIVTFCILCKGYQKNKKKALVILYGSIFMLVLGGTLCFAALGNTYQKDRVGAFVERVMTSMGASSYQDVSKYEIMGQSKLIGDSQMDLVGRLDSDIYKDYILVYVIGKWGYLAVAVILAAILGLIIRIWKGSIGLRDDYGRALYVAIAVLFTIRFGFNLIECFGMATVMSTYLPFISYDFSFAMMDTAMIGFLLGIYRRKNLVLCPVRRMCRECE